MSKKIKYTPVKEGEVLDVSIAFSQAAALLDKVAKKALYENDAELILNVADRWITIGSLFAGAPESTEHVDATAKGKYGFAPQEEGDDDDE